MKFTRCIFLSVFALALLATPGFAKDKKETKQEKEHTVSNEPKKQEETKANRSISTERKMRQVGAGIGQVVEH